MKNEDNTNKKRPLESMEKLAEVYSRLFFTEPMEAKEKGKIIVLGAYVGPSSLITGIEDAYAAGTITNLAAILTDPQLLVRCHEAGDAYGSGTDGCSYGRFHLGSILLGEHNKLPNGEILKPDIAFDIQICEMQQKYNQLWTEAYGYEIPHFTLDVSIAGSRKNNSEHAKRFIKGQMYEAIDWLKKVTGKPWNEEKFVEGVKIDWEVSTLLGKIYMLIKASPAPWTYMDCVMIFGLVMRAGKHRKYVLEFLQTVYDELKHRVENHIGGMENEKCRMIIEGTLPNYAPSVLETFENCGVNIIGGRMLFNAYSAMDLKKDFSWEVPKTPEERGIEIKNTEDGVEALADMMVNHTSWSAAFDFERKIKEVGAIARDWQADTAIVVLDSGCPYYASEGLEIKDELSKNGIPVLALEYRATDPRMFSEAAVTESITSFLESLDLTSLN